ncbi:MAG TPA: M14 family metallopeptidase [Gemmatimonadaceae bacterium]|nr:M14 family metallopeptidase [Gemmatimonadaceae bacterium]
MPLTLGRDAEVFLPYEAVVDRLENAARQLPGSSVLHRDGLAFLRVGAASASDVDQGRPEIWLQGGLHACEWIGPAIVLRLMDELIRSSDLRDRATWYVLPVVDAHGYQRTWAGERFLRTTENGENPNLNFPYRWGEAPRLASRLAGKRLRAWMGPRPTSAGCVKSLVSELRRLTNLRLFLDFHGFGRLWLYPWCHSKEPSPHRAEHEAASAIAVAAANRLAGRSGYRAQAAAFTEIPMGGSCIDFVYGEIGCIHSYAVELPPSLPWGGVLGATLLGALRGDPQGWWKDGQAPSAEVATGARDEIVAALSALVDHLFGGTPPALT